MGTLKDREDMARLTAGAEIELDIGSSMPSLRRNGSKADLLFQWGYPIPARMEEEGGTIFVLG
jgi:hypothetical protein